jgi:alpha-1,6-mannosyltransferase
MQLVAIFLGNLNLNNNLKIMKTLAISFKPKHLPAPYYASLLGALVTTSLSLWLGEQDWAQQNTLKLGWLVIGQYSLLAVFMLTAWLTGPQTNTIRDFRWLIIATIAARILLVPIQPYTSNDSDRYLFDGKITVSGFDPYRVSHDAKSFEALRTEWPTPSEHAKYTTLYPPLALGLFSLAASTGPDYALLTWKVLVTMAGIGTLLFMILVLKQYGKLPHIALVALSPILILETGESAHIDSFSALAVSASLYFWLNKRLFICGIVIGLGVLSKMLPLLLLIPFIFSLKRFSSVFVMGFGTFFTLVSGYGLAYLFGLQPIGSIGTFFNKWRNGSPLFNFLESSLSPTLLLVCLALLVIVGFASVAYFSWRDNGKFKRLNPRTLQWSLMIPLLITPVIFPWYLMPLVPLFALSPNIFMLLWFVLLPLSYEVLNQFACCNVWQPASWPITLLATGLVFGLLVDRFIVVTYKIGIKTNVKTA